jgi:ubiquitin-conjugating enzyme E2 O
MLTLRTMLHLLRRRPPALEGYEALVAGHFRRRGRFVLRACEEYLQGCPVGTLDAEARATEEAAEGDSGRRQPCSAGLRLALNGIVPRLVEAFTEMGAADGCEQFGRLRLPLAGGGGAVAPTCI